MNASVKPIIKSRQRVAKHGEVFTPPFIVEQMLDLVQDKVRHIQSRFLEPACGDGNFLTAILHQRLAQIDRKYRRNQPEWEIHAFFAVSSLYGIELLADNVVHCHRHLLHVFRVHYEDNHPKFWTADKHARNNQFFEAVRFVIDCNIVQGNALTMCRTHKGGDELPLPIIFSEWNHYQNNQIIRKEWVYQDLVNKDTPNKQTPSFRQPENKADNNQEFDTDNQQGDLFFDLFAETAFRQPETVINGGLETQPTKIQNNEKQSIPSAAPFTQTREFFPVNYWEISEEIYQKPRRHQRQGGRNA